MRPYLAIIKDSFREAMASRVLWVLLALITVTLVALAPLTYRETITVGMRRDDVEAWPALIEKLRDASHSSQPSPGKRIWSLLDADAQKVVADYKGLPERPTMRDVRDLGQAEQKLFKSLDKAIRRDDFDDGVSWKGVGASSELKDLQKRPAEKLTQQERLRLNRLLLEAAFPDLVRSSPATSFQFRYAVWDLSMPFPIRKQQFADQLFQQLPMLIDKFILSIGLLVAVLVTAPIIPQMFDPGSLHLLLSKPIARPLLYLSKFVGGCAFVFVAATYLFLGLWLIIGVQWGIWEPQLLWCIPVYVFVFATYFSVSALAGALWRNTIVAVIVTILFWALCFSVGTGHDKLGGMILRYRLARILPAGDALLAADEVNTLLVWQEDAKQWKPLVTSNEHEQIRTTLILTALVVTTPPPLPPLVGPAYDERQQQVVAAAPSFKMFGRMVMLSAKKSPEWKAVEGAPPAGQPFALLVEPDGHPLLVTSSGVSRVMRDVSAGAVMLRLPGFSLPLSKAEALQPAGPSPAIYWGDPATAAMDAASGRLFVYSRGDLIALAPGTGGTYAVAKEAKLKTEDREPAILAAGGGRCYVALKSGRLLTLPADTLAELDEQRLPGESPPRAAAATPDGKRLLVLTHDGVLHALDTASGQFSKPAVRGQGDISALTVTPGGKLYIASRATRVSEYDLATMKETQTYSATLNLQERSYYYAIQPLHAVLPKPGEFYKTVQYLLSGDETIASDDDNLAVQQTRLNPWSPIWSGLVFQAVMLTLGCLYIHWQEF